MLQTIIKRSSGVIINRCLSQTSVARVYSLDLSREEASRPRRRHHTATLKPLAIHWKPTLFKPPATTFIRRQSSQVVLNLKDQLSQQGRTTVITGGARGIGFYLAEAIASLGGDVALLDIVEVRSPLDELRKRYGTRVQYYKTDVTRVESIEQSFDRVIADSGSIDNCVTAAGIALDKPFLDSTWEETRKVLDVNILGTFFAAQSAAKWMLQQKKPGSIVTIASIAAHGAIPGQRVSIYGASKAAVKLMTKTLAVELAPSNIRINSISPGFIYTDMTGQFKHLQAVFERAPPMGRIGQRQDLALAVAYLLSPVGAGYTTGADLPVTGGLHGGRIEI